MKVSLYKLAYSAPLYSITFELENMSATHVGGMACLSIQGFISRKVDGGLLPKTDSYPILFQLHGGLYVGNAYELVGASLLPADDLPISFEHPDNERLINLRFVSSQQYIQYAEDRRASSQPNQDMTLYMRLRGMQSTVLRGEQPRIVSMDAVQTDNQGVTIRIPRSDWIGRFLPGYGYPQARTIQIPPLDGNTVVEELRQATQHLNEARRLFDLERYREAVQRCRQARDALLVPDKMTWCQEHLSAAIGMEKAIMLDKYIASLSHLDQKASHGDNLVPVDREAAEFVIGSLALALNYIDRKLG